MQILSRPGRRDQAGYALLITLTFVLIALLVFSSIMFWAGSSARVTSQNNLYNTSQAAAQGAIERVVAQMDRDFIYQSLNDSNVYQPLVLDIDQSSWPVKFQFGDTNGNLGQIYVSIPQNWGTNYSPLNAQFEGLYGSVANCHLVAVAIPSNAGYDMAAKVEETVQLALIPVFQFGVFYNLDLDFSPGQPLTMNGKVHCNGTIWMCPQDDAYFKDAVESTMLVTNKDNPNDQQNLTFSGANLHYTINPVSGVDTLAIPISGANTNNSATNVEALLNLPPAAIAVPSDAAYNPTNQIYLYNQCDLIISNSISGINGASRFGTNLTVFFSDHENLAGPLLRVTNDLQWVSAAVSGGVTNYLTNCYYSFVTNVTFRDMREDKIVQAVQFDVGKFNLWLTNRVMRNNGDGTSNYVAGYPWNNQLGGADGAHGDKGHPINSVFIYNRVPLTGSQLPAVRVCNGSVLPSARGLTIATPMPLYTLGNYNTRTNLTLGGSSAGTTNTAWTWPAALMGDAITILSGNWDDTISLIPGNAVGQRPATTTTVNAACLEGIVQSTRIGNSKHYSGGLENFLRLMEDWGGQTLTYNGSIVVMFPSIYATNFWIQPGNYYKVPTRQWGFDANFQYPEKSPPCVPQAKAIIRGSWRAGQ